ncbi:MAG: glycosyltransferase [Holosporaceae bacterium]|jgi:glycosyltransferase involved in cell wall biosynthesis|nr:glycosyltransferase [Holosporaceae bacterium]
MAGKNIVLSLVVPLYNEADSVDVFFAEVMPVLRELSCEFEIICVNDGSSDNTFDKLIQKKKIIPQIKIVDFSRNFGKDSALTAGLDFAAGECVIPMDCDLQDPPNLILPMVEKWKNIYGI